MRKLSLILFLVILCSNYTHAQSPDDQSKVLQKCIDLTEIQEYLPGKSTKTEQSLYVMQHGVSFGKEIKASRDGVPLAFLSKQEINLMRPESYFLFWTFEITEKTARVSFVYNYDQSKKAVRTDLELVKKGSEWNVTNVTINKV